MSTLKPTVAIPSLKMAMLDFVRPLPQETRAITWDLDSTLIDHYDEYPPEAHLRLLNDLAGIGLALGIISNAGSEQRTQRVHRVADVISQAVNQEIYVVTSRMVGGAKKPLRPVFDKAAADMKIPARNIVHVGDQLLKDVLGANRAGYGGTVLVAKYGEDDDRRVKYLQRPLEALLRPLVGADFK